MFFLPVTTYNNLPLYFFKSLHKCHLNGKSSLNTSRKRAPSIPSLHFVFLFSTYSLTYYIFIYLCISSCTGGQALRTEIFFHILFTTITCVENSARCLIGTQQTYTEWSAILFFLLHIKSLSLPALNSQWTYRPFISNILSKSRTCMLNSPPMASMWSNSSSTSLALTFCWAPYFNVSYGGSTL